jgi:hypothetical protein
MKTYIITSALSFIFALSLLAGNSQGYSESETFVDDIPFNTGVVASLTDNHDLFVKLWDLNEEMPADDIPFNTSWIAVMSQTPPQIMFDEEAYIDDIPFNTEWVASNTMADQITVEEEAVEDIPFNQEAIYNEVIMGRVESNVFDEAAANDVPFNTELIASNTMIDHQLLKDYTSENSVDDVPVKNIDDFLAVAFADYFAEETVNDIPFDTEEIFCANVCCEKNKGKIRFTRKISHSPHTFTRTALISTRAAEGQNNMSSLLDSIEEFWMTELSSGY